MSMDAESTGTKGKSHWGLRWFYDLYRDGLRSQSRTSRLLWIIVAIKLFIMFAILRPIFFPRVISDRMLSLALCATHARTGCDYVDSRD